MKIAQVCGFLMVLNVVQFTFARPLETEEEKELKSASIYVLGNLSNAAVAHEFSKTQAASDRNESEWNSTEMMNTVSHGEYNQDDLARGGDAANVAIAYQASEAQAAENDQKSGYNNQNLGMGSHTSESEEDGDVEEEK